MIQVAYFILQTSFLLAINQLDDASFRKREAAHEYLTRTIAFSWPAVLVHADNPTHEIARRCYSLVSRVPENQYWDYAGRIFLRHCTRHPWLNLVDEDGYIDTDGMRLFIDSALRRLGMKRVSSGGDWPEYRVATRIWIDYCLREELPLEHIKAELNRMLTLEIMARLPDIELLMLTAVVPWYGILPDGKLFWIVKLMKGMSHTAD
jgi:hypothetical protein